MRDLGKLWSDCHTGKILEGRWEYQRKIVIGNVTFEDNNLVDVNFSRGLMAKSISFGNTIAASLSAIIIPHTDQVVYRNSKVTYYVRVIDLYDNVSPWAKFGEFYVDKVEKEFDKYRIECFDIMYLSEDRFPQGNYTAKQAVSMIASDLGVSVVNPGSFSDFDMNIKQNFTHREILGFIASMNIGNFFINEEGNLKFTKLTISSPVQSILPSNTKKIVGSESIKFDKVTVKYGNGQDEKLVAGSGSSEFEIFNPFADSQMANRLLNFFNNYTFYPGDMSSTGIDPAIELGDTINVDGLKVNLINVSYSVRMYASVDIPYETNKLQDVFYFEAAESKDYDEEIEDHEDRISILENLMNSLNCNILKKADLNKRNEIKTEDEEKFNCVIISDEVTELNNLKSDRVSGGKNLIKVGFHPKSEEWRKNSIDYSSLAISRKLREINFAGDFARRPFKWVDGLEFGDFEDFTITKTANMFNNSKFKKLTPIIDLMYSSDKASRLFYGLTVDTLDMSKFKLNSSIVEGLMFSDMSFKEIKGMSYDLFRGRNRFLNIFSRSTIGKVHYDSINLESCVTLNSAFYRSTFTEESNYDVNLNRVDINGDGVDIEGIVAESNVKNISINKGKVLTLSRDVGSRNGSLRRLSEDCSSIEKIDIKPVVHIAQNLPAIKGNTYYVDIYNIHKNCINLKNTPVDNLTAPGFQYIRRNPLGDLVSDTLAINMTDAFVDCKSITNPSLNLSSFNDVIWGYHTNPEDFMKDPKNNPFRGSSIKKVIMHGSTSSGRLEYLTALTGVEFTN